MKNSIDLGGATLSSAGHTGEEDYDVSTKRYVDRWHVPDIGGDDDDHYQRVIKSREWLMGSLTRLCKISTTLGTYGNIVTVLEGAIFAKTFYFLKGSVQGKYIEVTYLKQVWVDEWIFETDIKLEIQVVFKWQASNDGGETWTDIGGAEFVCTDPSPLEKDITLNMGRWKFRNPKNPIDKQRYSCWRLMGVSGTMKSAHYVNSMLMYLR